jgi:molybdopterin molybdotransferase
MISVEDALRLVHENVFPNLDTKGIEVRDAVGFVLSEDIFSPINMPPFRQSAMDGYAIHVHEDQSYQLIGEVKAGDDHQPVLKSGEAVRIFTGAPVPDTANSVVIQEKVNAEKDFINTEASVQLGSNIRPLGEQVKKGELALKKGTLLTPAAIGYLSSLGIEKVSVYNEPKIAIVITGSELIEPGVELSYGKIYESNSAMLYSILRSMNYTQVSIHKVQDDYNTTKKTLEDIIRQHDLVLVSGGISVGDYDFVGKALNELNVEQVFYKVNQKPGKPLFFGKKDSSYVFALPGNPASALTCFYVYVTTALRKLSGKTENQNLVAKASCRSEFKKKGNRAQFLKAMIKNSQVEILEGQSSAMLHTFALANALIYVPGEKMSISKGEWVDVIPLPI